MGKRSASLPIVRHGHSTYRRTLAVIRTAKTKRYSKMNYDPKKALQTTKYIYYGFVAMPTLFALAVSSMLNEQTVFEISFENPLILSLVILALLIFPASILVPKQQTKTLKSDDELKKKLASFQTAFIIKTALWIGVANFAIVVALLSMNYFPFIIGIIVILIIASFYPNISQLKKTIPLNNEDINSLK
jgi:hypothetical protein